MKIGILTYHRTHNYGGCLQALATRIILERMGHEVYYVDYWPEYHRKAYKLFNWSQFVNYRFKGKLFYVFSFLKTFIYARRRQNEFEKFHNIHTAPYCKPLTEEYDVIIYGSDQIWRKQSILNDYNFVYFGENEFVADRHIAFSASMGILPNNEDCNKHFFNTLSRFDSISVREDSLRLYLEQLGLKEVKQTLDPTLLLNANEWDMTLPSISTDNGNKKYILIYSLWGDVFNLDSINKIAKKEDLVIKVLRGEVKKRDTEKELSVVGPSNFLELIKNAEYVFTSSFHGLAFSLIYNKQVFASFKINGDRALSLLKTLEIPERYLSNYETIPEYIKPINYGLVNQKLEILRNETISYLQLSINNDGSR